jgi:hypothetical protein
MWLGSFSYRIVTYFMEKSHAAWEDNGHPACPETSCLLGNTDLLAYLQKATTKSQSTPIYNVLLMLALLIANKKIGLGVDTEKLILFLSCEQNGEQNHNIKIGNKSSEMLE